MQKLAKHAEPTANKLSDKMEGGAHKFAKHAGPATKEFSDRAIDAAEDLSKNAAPKAHQVCPAWLFLFLEPCIGISKSCLPF